MSVAVGLEELHQRIEEYGPAAHLVTIGDAGRPHVVAVLVRLEGDRLVAGAGRTTAANATARPAVTLLWAAGPGQDYSLIVDGTAAVDGDAEELTVRPTGAVLHKSAAATSDGPTCVKILRE